MKKLILFILLIAFPFFIYSEDIRIAAAANLSYVLEELKQDFQKDNPKINVEIILGSSGKLTAQIMAGAPYDIFMSADMKYPDNLHQAGFSLTKPVIYAKGSLILFTTRELDLKKGLGVLTDPQVNSISIANLDLAPYGKASIEALTNYGIYSQVTNKIINAESISQVIHQAITAADIGLTAKSLLYSKEMQAYKKGINWIEVDPKLYKKIDQGIIILKNKIDKPEVELFYEYILSNKAKTIFKKYGYEV